MSNNAYKKIVSSMREEGENKGYDDWHYLTDEELLNMNPMDEIDAAFTEMEMPLQYSLEDIDKMYELEDRLQEVLEDIAKDEEMLKNETNYMIKTELYADIRDERMIQAKILNEMEAIRNKYENNNRSL